MRGKKSALKDPSEPKANPGAIGAAKEKRSDDAEGGLRGGWAGWI